MSARSRSSVAAALFVLIVAACGSDRTSTSSTPVQSVTAGPSSTPTTTATPTTAPTTTAAATTTLPPTSVLPVVPAGWSEVDRESLSPKAFPPCCGDTWHGVVSPTLAPAGESLADGPYAVTMRWPDDPTQPLELEVFRFEQCALLPEFSCEPRPAYTTDELGVDTSTSRPLTVALDDRMRVVVVGWDDAALEIDRFVVKQANGTDLGALAAVVNQAYGDVFADRFDAGEDPSVIVADVLANPTGGFTKAVNSIEDFMFTPNDGPPLLFQVVFPYLDGQPVAGRGTDVLGIRSIDIVDGQVTAYIYSAYIP